jgi:hypothetical protein
MRDDEGIRVVLKRRVSPEVPDGYGRAT